MFFEKALEDYAQLGLRDKEEDIAYHICSCYYGLRENDPFGEGLDLAEEAYRRFIDQFPGSERVERARMLIAAFWTERGWNGGKVQKAEAITRLELTIRETPDEAPAHVRSRLHLMAGEMYSHIADRENALPHFVKSIAISEQDPNPVAKRRTQLWAHYFSLYECMKLHDAQLARSHLRYLEENPPTNQDELFNLSLESFVNAVNYYCQMLGVRPVLPQ